MLKLSIINFVPNPPLPPLLPSLNSTTELTSPVPSLKREKTMSNLSNLSSSSSSSTTTNKSSSRPTMVTFSTDITMPPTTQNHFMSSSSSSSLSSTSQRRSKSTTTTTTSSTNNLFDGSSDLSHLFNLKRPFKIRISKNSKGSIGLSLSEQQALLHYGFMVMQPPPSQPSSQPTPPKQRHSQNPTTTSNLNVSSRTTLRKSKIQKPSSIQLLGKSKSKCTRATVSSMCPPNMMMKQSQQHTQQYVFHHLQNVGVGSQHCPNQTVTSHFPNIVSTNTNMELSNKNEQFIPNFSQFCATTPTMSQEEETRVDNSSHCHPSSSQELRVKTSTIIPNITTTTRPTKKGRTSISIRELLN
nr:unnamed protein product [Naegleria fowleri]